MPGLAAGVARAPGRYAGLVRPGTPRARPLPASSRGEGGQVLTYRVPRAKSPSSGAAVRGAGTAEARQGQGEPAPQRQRARVGDSAHGSVRGLQEGAGQVLCGWKELLGRKSAVVSASLLVFPQGRLALVTHEVWPCPAGVSGREMLIESSR